MVGRLSYYDFHWDLVFLTESEQLSWEEGKKEKISRLKVVEYEGRWPKKKKKKEISEVLLFIRSDRLSYLRNFTIQNNT